VIYENLSFQSYLDLPGYGSSDLKTMRQGPPAMVQWRRSHPIEETPAVRIGTAAHCKILTPHLFDVYAVKPAGMTFASKDGKAWRDEMQAAGKIILSQDESAAINGICAAFQSKEAAARAMLFAEQELSFTWQDSLTGVALKGRADWTNPEDRCVYDLKTGSVATKPNVASAAFYAGWGHQLAHYRSGLRANGINVDFGRIVCIGQEAPYPVHLLEIDADTLDLLALDNEKTCDRIAECELSGVWPGTPDTWTRILPPANWFEMAPETDWTAATEEVAQ